MLDWLKINTVYSVCLNLLKKDQMSQGVILSYIDAML